MPRGPRTYVHLSDLHFGRDHSYPQERSVDGRPTLLDAISKDLESAGVKPDRVLISGDLVSTGARDEYTVFRGFLDLLTRTNNLKPEHVLIVPGNHDVYWGKAPDSVSRGEYEAFLSTYFRVPVGDAEPARMLDDDVAIIGLDTTKLQRQSTSGIGLIGPDQLREAEKLLETDLRRASTRILVLHHHLLPVAWLEPEAIDGKPSLTLDGPSVLSWAQEHGFAMVMHGHQHQSFLATFHLAAQSGGQLLVAGAPTAGGRDLPPQGRNGYHIVHIDGRNITVSVRELTEQLRFEEARRVQFVREPTGTFAVGALPSTRHAREPSVAELRTLMKNAVHAVKRVLAEAYGPSGGLRVIAEMRGAKHVRDGERIISSLSVDDPVENRIFAIARDLARSISNEAGDGRKTAVLLWAELVSKGLDVLETEEEQTLVNSLANAAQRAITRLKESTRANLRSDDIVDIARCASGNHKDIGPALVNAMKQAGKEGIIEVGQRVDASLSEETIELDVRMSTFEGLKVPPWFSEVAPPLRVDLKDPAFVLCDGIVKMHPLMRALEPFVRTKRPVVVVARKFDEDALSMMALNAREKVVVAIPLVFAGPRHEGVLEDLSVLTGARIFTPSYSADLDRLVPEDGGIAPAVHISTSELRLEGALGGTKERIHAAVTQIRDRQKATTSSYEKELLQQRLARMVGAYVVITAVGVSASAAEILASSLADAVFAARGAIEEGVVPGCGEAYLQVADDLENGASAVRDAGTTLLAHALRQPASVLRSHRGSGERVLDSGKSLRLALSLAVEAAIRTLRTRTMEIPEQTVSTRVFEASEGNPLELEDEDEP